MLARTFTVALGCMAVIWGVVTLPVFWRETVRDATAVLIVQGHRYATPVLAEEISKFEKTKQNFCRAPALRSAAMVRLKLVENALEEADRVSIDERMAELKRGIIDLFACDPTDSFFWLVYYWTNLTTDGFNPNLLRFLRMSYQQGPNEGWIAIKRNRLALAIFSQLTPELSDLALDEFSGIVRSGLIEDAAAILTGPGWNIRDDLLAHLVSVPLAERERLALTLRNGGHDVVVPGVDAAPRRFFN
jgi:hypothetical protein